MALNFNLIALYLSDLAKGGKGGYDPPSDSEILPWSPL